MTVTSGYKQIDSGIIPIDWEVARIDQLAAITTGSRNTQDRVEDGPYPFFVRSQQIERINTYSYDGEAVLTVGDGRIGKVFHYINGKFDVHQRVYCISQFSDRLNGRYFFYQFSSRFYRRSMSMTAKSSVDSVRLEMIAGMKVPIPPLAEQHAIAAALSDVDALLGGLDQLIVKKRSLKQATMQQLLTGEIRLSGFDGEWEIKCVGEIGTTYGGLAGKTKADFGVGRARYVTFLNVLKSVVIDPYQCEPVRVEPGEHQNLIRKGDILFNGTSETPDDLAMAAVSLKDEDNLFLNSFCFGFRIHDPNKHLPLFLAYYFRGPPGRQIMRALAQGATRYNMSKSQFMALTLSLPLHNEQKAIATVLSDMDAEITALETRRNKTHDLKQAMMQELLTGRTRLVKLRVAHA